MESALYLNCFVTRRLSARKGRQALLSAFSFPRFLALRHQSRFALAFVWKTEKRSESGGGRYVIVNFICQSCKLTVSSGNLIDYYTLLIFLQFCYRRMLWLPKFILSLLVQLLALFRTTAAWLVAREAYSSSLLFFIFYFLAIVFMENGGVVEQASVDHRSQEAVLSLWIP